MNHKPIRWLSLVDTVRKRLGPHTQVVPLRQWIKTLEGHNGDDPHELTTKPAIKILYFYRGFEGAGLATGLKYSMSHEIEARKTMAELPPVNSEWMSIWLDQWGY